MTRHKTLAALALGASFLAATAFGQGSTESRPGSMMGGMHERMTPMMDGCARMMETTTPPEEGQTDNPAPGKGQTQ
jgi:hypothetical protein